MCFASTPDVPPVPPPPPDPATEADPAVKAARGKARQNARSAQGLGSTVITGPAGDTSTASTTAGKTTLGS